MTAVLIIVTVTVFADYGSMSKIGTNEALGSPLLDSDYDINKWDSDELAIFGIFLSNYVTPFLDDYESAYSTGSKKGTDGYGYRALQFGTGSADDVLKGMLNFVIQASKNQSSLRPLYVDEKQALPEDFSAMANDNAEQAKTEQATVKNIFPQGTMNVGGIEGAMNQAADISGLSRLYVDVSDAGLRKKIVLDYNESYDKQMMLMFLNSALHRAESGEYKSAYNNIDTKSIADRPIYLDVFGNIVYQSEDNRLVMLFPACANSHITADPQYNLLNSVFLGGYYSDATTADLWNTIAGKGGLAQYDKAPLEAVGKRDVFAAGEFILGYDMAEMGVSSPTGADLVNFLKSDVNRGSQNAIGLKVQTTSTSFVEGINNAVWLKNTGVTSFQELFDMVYKDKRGMNPKTPTLHTIQVRGGINKFDILGEPIATSVSTTAPVSRKTADAYNPYSVEHRAINFLRTVLVDRPTTLTYISPDSIESQLLGASDTTAAAKILFDANGGSMKMSSFMAEMITKSGWARVFSKSKGKTITEVDLGSLTDAGYKALTGTGINGGNIGDFDKDVLTRPLILYAKNSTLREVNRVFSGDINAEFAAWTPDLYLTYLEWYGLTNQFGSNKLDPALFKEGSFDVDLTAFSNDYVTEEDKRSSIIDSTYLMLNPAKGRDLRHKINATDFTEMIHDWYTKIVYGGASENSYDGKYSVTTKRNSAGYLEVRNYSDNPFTAWFVNNYAQYAFVLLGIAFIIVIIVGLTGRRGVRYWLISFAWVTNILILTPVIGDVAPFLSNRALTAAFDDTPVPFLPFGTHGTSANTTLKEPKDVLRSKKFFVPNASVTDLQS
ncbi:hypothetical protein FACS1894188_01630 [Clostridia bacterium]|nr:hypothetical protein FACS1894188_01630 [Clostridia bacterium]